MNTDTPTPRTDEFEALRDAMSTRASADYVSALQLCDELENDTTKPEDSAVRLETLCTGCQKPMVCHWPPMTTWGGLPCTAAEYMSKALQSESVGIYCDDCLEKMPDVKLEDLCYE